MNQCRMLAPMLILVQCRMWAPMLILALLIGGGCATNAASPAKKVEDLPNFHPVHNYLYRGGEPTVRGLEKLQKMHIDTVVDLRGAGTVTQAEKAEVERLGMRYINLPMDSRAPSDKLVSTFVETVEKAQNSSDSTKPAVFVHCQHGSDRTGCLVGAWRVSHEGWDYDRAYKEMRKYYFSPKFTNLSDTVRKYCKNDKQG